MAKISGPLLDRIDLHLEVPAVPYRELSSTTPGTSSAQMREQVVRARLTQRERFHNTRIRGNAKMGPRQIRQYCVLDAACQELLKASMNELGLSARTIADLDGSADIQAPHLSEAINYRMLDRSFWT
jgi:magnesium chelatase family protein